MLLWQRLHELGWIEGRTVSRGVRRRGGENVIKGTAEPVALPAPEAQSPEATPEPKQKHKSDRL
jgi:hypothetical protein